MPLGECEPLPTRCPAAGMAPALPLLFASHPQQRLRAACPATFCLQHGADVHAIDSFGRTALIYAAGSGDASLVSALIQRGADIHHEDVNGACALILATNGGHCHLVAPLLLRVSSRGSGGIDARLPHYSACTALPCPRQ